MVRPAEEPLEKTLGDERLEQAVGVLRAGGLVAFPTETVYGLGADAANSRAVAKIFAVKGRPERHPLIVHLPSAHALAGWAATVPVGAYALAERFWPGPLTLVLRKHPRVLKAVTGAQETVGLRVPAHPVARALLARFSGGVAAPSANRFGRISPTTAAHVRAELGEAAYLLDGGACEVGLESTIVDLSGEAPRLLRPGGVRAADIEEVLGARLEPGASGSPRAPGALASHYAPLTPAVLLPSAGFMEALAQVAGERPVAVLARQDKRAVTGIGTEIKTVAWLTLPADPAAYAKRLYAALRELDAQGGGLIAVEAVPEDEAWAAVRDRLRRATHRAGVS